MFTKNLKLDEGYVQDREYRKDRNTQNIYIELKNKMTSSTFILEPSPSLPCLDFSKLNCQNWYTDLSKMLTGFVNVAKWIC